MRKTAAVLLAMLICSAGAPSAAHAATPHPPSLSARYSSRLATPHERRFLHRWFGPIPLPGVPPFDIASARKLVTVRLGRAPISFFAAPTIWGDGLAIGQFNRRGVEVGDGDASFDPLHRHPSRSAAGVVGVASALDAEPFIVGDDTASPKPAIVIVGDVRGHPALTAVRVRFQDGTTTAAHRSGIFFSYAAYGAHMRRGHRPIALLGLSSRGTVRVIQHLAPASFRP